MQNSFHGYSSAYLQSYTKRVLDIFLVLISLLPLLFLFITCGVVLLVIEGRPILFIQKRVGHLGDLFDVIKLRTLRKNTDPYSPSPDNYSQKLLKMGKFLRRKKLDEIPQLLSVIKGQMSFVGPRPELALLTDNYKDSHLSRRLNAKPGLTGLWQIKADTTKPIYENINYDLYYIRKASLMFDLKLVALTAVFMLRNKDV